MNAIERWTLVRRTDWRPSYTNPYIVPPGVEPPASDPELEVFDVVRAEQLRGVVQERDMFARAFRLAIASPELREAYIKQAERGLLEERHAGGSNHAS
jgi:hypothetical protein